MMIKGNTFFILVLIVFVACSRLVPHPLNVTPVGALALFAGAYVSTRYAWAVPIAALLIGDAITGFYGVVSMFFVYTGFACSVLLGYLFLHNKRSIGRLGGSVLTSSVTFYLLSNFGEWLVYYPHTFASLLQCYINGLPYLERSMIANSLYTIVLFGLYEGVRYYWGRYEQTHVRTG